MKIDIIPLLRSSVIQIAFWSLASCSFEASHIESNNKHQENIDLIVNSVKLIQNEITTSREVISNPIDQETINFFCELLGLAPESVSLEEVNEVIAKYSLATDLGIEAVLEQYELTNFTKEILAEITQGNTFENLYEISGFSQLPVYEKDLIEATNLFVIEAQNKNIGCGIGAFIGFVVGSFVCTPICQIVGVIIGCSIGKGAN